jgi:hypothetical protein
MYEVKINMEKILLDMKRLGLKRNCHKTVIVYVSAKDPDGACAGAIKQICRELRREKDSTTEKNASDINKLSRKAKGLIYVTKVIPIGTWA